MDARLDRAAVSIHAPTRGATSTEIYDEATFTEVSIHAPTRGATCFDEFIATKQKSFNPRTHTGCDIKEIIAVESRCEVSIHAPTRGATV